MNNDWIIRDIFRKKTEKLMTILEKTRDDLSKSLLLWKKSEYPKGIDWEAEYKKACEGNPDTQYLLGCQCVDGTAVERNYEYAVDWFRMAAENGNSKAYSRLAQLYFCESPLKDEILALKYAKESADSGDAQMQYIFGLFSVIQNIDDENERDIASGYLIKAAENGSGSAQLLLGKILWDATEEEEFDGLTKRIGLEYLKCAANQGSWQASYIYGYSRYSMTEVKADWADASKYLNLALSNEDTTAEHRIHILNALATMSLWGGDGIKKNISQAQEYISLAEEIHSTANTKNKPLSLGNTEPLESIDIESHPELRQVLLKGSSEDQEAALQLLLMEREQSEEEQITTWVHAGEIYFHGTDSVCPNNQCAVFYWKKAAHKNHLLALLRMGENHLLAYDGNKPEEALAKEYFQKVLESGKKFELTKKEAKQIRKRAAAYLKDNIAEWLDEKVSEENSFRFRCIHCGQVLCASLKSVGQETLCPACEEDITVGFYRYAMDSEEEYPGQLPLPEIYLQADELAEEGQGEEAYELYKKLADQNIPPACERVGLMRMHGKDVEKDFEEARKYYRQGTMSDNGDCYFLAGLDASCLNKDNEAGFIAHHRASCLGCVVSMEDVAISYESDCGKIDFPESRKWFQRNGSDKSIIHLGKVYEYGIGVPINYDTAAKWYEEAEEAGKEELRRLNQLRKSGEWISEKEPPLPDLSVFPDDFKPASESELLRDMNPESMYRAGIAFMEGIGTAPDYDRGILWLKRAAFRGLPEAVDKVLSLKLAGVIADPQNDIALKLAEKLPIKRHNLMAMLHNRQYALENDELSYIEKANKWVGIINELKQLETPQATILSAAMSAEAMIFLVYSDADIFPIVDAKFRLSDGESQKRYFSLNWELRDIELMSSAVLLSIPAVEKEEGESLLRTTISHFEAAALTGHTKSQLAYCALIKSAWELQKASESEMIKAVFWSQRVKSILMPKGFNKSLDANIFEQMRKKINPRKFQREFDDYEILTIETNKKLYGIEKA
mgnify:CR=1 FL=1